MNKLNKLFKLVSEQIKTDNQDLFENGFQGYLYVLFTFVLRYKAIESELGLTILGANIEKYQKNSTENLDPYDDIIFPFFEFYDSISQQKPGNTDFSSFFGITLDVQMVAPESVQRFLNIINKAEIKDWSLSSFTKEEFDAFFVKLIQSITHKQDDWVRFYPVDFAEFIDYILPKNKSIFYLGDEKADLSVQRVNKDSESFLTGYNSNIFWYYLRPILFGEKKLKLKLHEFSSLYEVESDVVVGHIPFGKMGKGFPIEMRRFAKTLEGFYIKLISKSLSKRNGIGYLLIPQFFLFKKNKEYFEIRKRLVESGAIKIIIRLPNAMFTPTTSLSYALIIVDYSMKSNSVKFIDGMNIFYSLNPTEKKDQKSFFELLKSYYVSDPFFSESKNISINEISKNQYSLAISNYINAHDEAHKYLRFADEELESFYDIFSPLTLNSIKDPEKGLYLRPVDLSETIDKISIDLTKLSQYKKTKYVKELKRDALLLTIWNSKFRIGKFKYTGKSMYLMANVKAFELNKDHFINYLVYELMSDFVTNQLKKIETGNTLPADPNSLLKNLFLRIPSKEQQIQVYNTELQTIAEERLDEIEGLSQSINFIEKDVFSSFAHDFGKLLHKVSLNINSLENYLKLLDKKGVIRMKDSIFGDDLAESGQSVSELISRAKSNQNQAVNFLKSEVLSFTSESLKFEIFDIGSLILKWISREDLNGYKIILSEGSSLSEHDIEDALSQKYEVYGIKNQVLSILNNFLDNALSHGFTKKDKDYVFRLHLEKRNSDYGRLHQVSLHVANNGLPFPDDFTCKDFFTRKHAGKKSDGEGIGGYSIKRSVENMKAEIRCNSTILPKSEFPVRFQVIFKKIEVSSNELSYSNKQTKIKPEQILNSKQFDNK